MATEESSFKISVNELREITNTLLDHLEDVVDISDDLTKDSEGVNATLKDDYYWHIPKEQRYNVLKKPSEFTIGQLTDDWYELQKFLNKEEYEPLSYGLVWLAAIFKAIGEKVVV